MIIMIPLSPTLYFATNCLMSLFVLILMPVANVDEMYSSLYANKFLFQTHHASVLSSAGLLFLRLLPLTTVTLESARLFSRLPWQRDVRASEATRPEAVAAFLCDDHRRRATALLDRSYGALAEDFFRRKPLAYV